MISLAELNASSAESFDAIVAPLSENAPLGYGQALRDAPIFHVDGATRDGNDPARRR